MLKLICQHNRCFLLCCADLSWYDYYITLEWDKYCQDLVCFPNNLRWKSCWHSAGIRFLLIRGNSWRINAASESWSGCQYCGSSKFSLRRTCRKQHFSARYSIKFWANAEDYYISLIPNLLIIRDLMKWGMNNITISGVFGFHFMQSDSWAFGQAGKNSVSDLNRVSFFLSRSCHRTLLHHK